MIFPRINEVFVLNKVGKFAVVYARNRFFNILKFLKSRNRKSAFLVFSGI